MMGLKFKYTNWRGNDHEYVISPERGGLEQYTATMTGRDGAAWMVSGDVVTRDGDVREGMGDNRRRSFELIKMRDIEEVEV